MHITLIQYWAFPKLFALLRFSQTSYNVEIYCALLQCWDTSKLPDLFKYTVPCYVADLFPILRHCWRIPRLAISLSYSQSQWKLLGKLSLVTLLSFSHFRNFAEVETGWLHCGAFANLEKILSNSQPHYMAEENSASVSLLSHTQAQWIFEVRPNFLFCWNSPNPITMRNFSQAHSIGEVYLACLQCWATPNLKLLLKYTRPCEIAELILISIHCWGIS